MRQVNLLPQETRKSEKIRFFRRSFLILFLPVLAVLLGVSFVMNAHIRHLKETAAQPLAFQETVETRKLKTQSDELERELQDYIRENREIIETFVRNSSCAYLLKIIGGLSENKVWLNGITLDKRENVCKIDGKSFNTRLVSEFMLEIKRLPFFRDVELVSVGKEAVKITPEVDFQILCYLK